MEEVELKTAEAATMNTEEKTADAPKVEEGKSGPEPKEIVAYLVKTYPNCFAAESSKSAKPLKIGLFNDLIERINWDEVEFSKTKLRVAIRYYTNSWEYLSSIVAGAKRVDLDGNEGEEVTSEHAEYAQARLADSKAKFEAAKVARLAAKKAARAAQGEREGQKRGPRKNGKFNANKAHGGKFEGRNGKRFDNRSNRNFKSQPKNVEPVPFEKLDAQEVTVGRKVHVMIGSSNVSAVVKEVIKGVVAVEFDTGMVARVAIDSVGK